GGRGAQEHYPLMETEQIAKIPVATYAADSAHLWLWYTNNFLPDMMQVGEAWGFRYVTQVTWPKTRGGLGFYAQGFTEHCALWVRGETIRGKRIRTLLDAWDHTER